MERSAARPPVIADVARAAEVSVPTVSRVLSGSARVSDHRRERVLAAVRELGYRPNSAARALVTGRRTLVSVITGNTTRYGYASTIGGIEEAGRAAGTVVAITVVDSAEPASVRQSVDLALAQPVVGVVVLDFDEQGLRVLEALPASVPVVAVTSVAGGNGRPRVVFDDYRGGRDATDHLLDLGHRTVHHVAVPSSGQVSGRLVGWREALLARASPVPEVLFSDWTPRSGYETGVRLAGDPSVTAVLCGNDEIAFGVVRALQDAGRDVPGDVSIVGFDDHPLSSLWSPPLTTMGQDFIALGRAAVGLLDVGAPAAMTVPPTPAPRIVVRASSAPPAS